MRSSQKRTVTCKCHAVEIELSGRPILVSICHCDDCRRGSAQIEGLPGAPEILDPYGGSPYVLYRKDRIALLHGRDLLVDQRIEGEKNTRRVVASCCNSPLFLDFEPGHWVSFYQQRFDSPVPTARMRVQTRFMPGGKLPDDGLPRHRGYPFGMVVKLLASRIAMGGGKRRYDL